VCRHREEDCESEVVVRVPLGAPKVLMAEIAEAAAVAALVRSTPGISGVYVVEPSRPGDVPTIQTDGINFAAAWQHERSLRLDAVTCNDVAQTLATFGVEAARATLVSQVRALLATCATRFPRLHARRAALKLPRHTCPVALPAALLARRPFPQLPLPSPRLTLRGSMAAHATARAAQWMMCQGRSVHAWTALRALCLIFWAHVFCCLFRGIWHSEGGV
jgi:hypothetical protein